MRFTIQSTNPHCPVIEIARDSAPVVIAELGINHAGSLAMAKQMVQSAARAGVQILKHQTHIVDDEMSAQAKSVIPGNSDKSIFDIMQACALSREEEAELKNYVESLGMIFISTPFSRAAANFLHDLGVPAFKIGSGEMNNFPLISHIADFKKPLIISTGMNTLSSVRRLVALLESKRAQYALLHTTNLYPTPARLVRLGAMQQLAQHFEKIPFGLSDHTKNNLACFAAIALGASIVERHFTDTMQREGPDIVCSMDEMAARELVRGGREIYDMRGGEKEPAKEEQVTIDFAFATCVSIADIRAGEIFTMKNLWAKRPNVKGAYPAEKLNEIIGRRARVDIAKDTHIFPRHVQ